MQTKNLSPHAAILESVCAGGIGRTKQTLVATVFLAFLAGSYIAFGGLLAIRSAGALPVEIWGSLAKLIFGMVFPLGLMLVIVCGADLFTGNCLTLTAARLQGRIGTFGVVRSLVFSYLGNFAGALFVAWTMVKGAGMLFEVSSDGHMPWAAFTIKMANAKVALDPMSAFWRGVGCNWLVCLAIYSAAEAKDTAGRILSLWMPTMAFVAIGFEHCVANMFFIPAALFVAADPRYAALAAAGKAPLLTADWSSFLLQNLTYVTAGNVVGGALFVAVFYCVAHVRELRGN